MSEARYISKEPFDDYTNNLKFDNMYNELEFYKSKCEVYEKDLFKSHTQIKKLELSIKKMQEINQVNAKNTNNTSIQFFLPSEFKNNWENCVKDQIMEAFENIYDNYYWLSHLVQDSVRCVYEETNKQIIEKVSSLLKLLSINENNHDNKFLPRFRTLFQEYFSSIFVFTDENHKNIKDKMIKEVIVNYKEFDEDIKDNFLKDIESKFYRNFCQSVFKLSIYMLLHDPILTLNIDPYEEREMKYLYYAKKEHMNIEGFGTESLPCIVILFPPTVRKSFSYQGIKPAVYMIPNPNEEIKKECEKNTNLIKKANTNEYSNYNSSKSEKIDIGENSLHSGRNSTQQNRLTPELSKTNNEGNSNLTIEKGSPNPINNIPTFHKEKNITNIRSKTIKYSEEPKSISALDNTAKTIQDSEVKKCYDHPLSITKTKKPAEVQKETNLLTLNNINIANINIANGVNLLSSNKNRINNDQKNLFSDNNIRSNSQNNLKNVSRNNSIKDSSNNSLNKDSLKLPERIDNTANNYCPNSLINNIRDITGNSTNTNKVSRTHFPSQILDIHKDIVNNQELLNKTDKNVAFILSNRKSNITNNISKNNYIMDNNLENECGKNDLCFKVYETNKINYPLKIDQGNYYTNSGKFHNSNSNCEKNDSDNSLIQPKENLQGNIEIGKSLIKFEKKRNNQKNTTYGSNNKTSLNIDNICFKNGESYLTKGKTLERNKNEKSPGLTSSNNSASNGNCNNNFNINSNQGNSNARNDSIKSSVQHVLEYVNKGLIIQKDQLNNNNHRTSIKSATNQDFLNKRGSIKGQDNSLLDNELNNCLFSNNVSSFNKYQQEIQNNDMKYNAPKKETQTHLEISNNHLVSIRIDRGGSKELNTKEHNKEFLTPKLDKQNQAQNLNDISPQKLDKIKNLPINLANKDKIKLYELNNNYITGNNFANSNINQNSARNTKNQFSFQQKTLKKN